LNDRICWKVISRHKTVPVEINVPKLYHNN
jgi:hypothetical protein